MDVEQKKHITKDVDHLLRFQSTASRPRDLLACAKWLRRTIKKRTVGANLTVQLVVNNTVPSLVVVQGVKWKQPDILLNGHFDVVPGKPADFKPVVKGDKIYGRGAADMKSGLVALLHGFIGAVQERPDLSLGLMFTGDEETGGANGVEHFVKQGWKAGEVICFDGGYGEQISHAEKGILRLEFTSTGKNGRVHHRWEGSCALEGIIQTYAILEKTFSQWNKATEENNWFSTFTPRSVVTEPNGNTMVTRARMTVSIHFVEDMTPEQVINTIRRQLPKNVSVKSLIEVPRVFTDKKNPEIKKFQKAYGRHLGHTPQVRAENGSSDARFFAHMGIPIIITKPKSGNPEMDGEWASLSSTWKLSKALTDYLVQH